MHLLISFNHNLSHSHRKGERKGDVSVKISVDVHYVYTGLNKVTTLYNIVTIVVQYQTSRFLLTMAW